jgi:hypothetical protein
VLPGGWDDAAAATKRSARSAKKRLVEVIFVTAAGAAYGSGGTVADGDFR